MTKKFKLQIAANHVNLYKWVTEMTPAEYESFSKGHKAMGSYFEDGEFYKAYICRWIPAIVGVPWEMKITPIDNTSYELSCTIGADFPSRLLAIAAWINGFGGFFRKEI
ncbi:hypothetical protein NSS79_07675 [Paenibacillus sp. FSL L8-0436]|uniref:hypothetical protein n=1 Tax=Paenibacillus sp. FSL L8-0436 TaxID=2954686 RepID=UPI003159387A